MPAMAYDALQESVRLLQDGLPPGSVALSRRRRHAALAVDRDGDVAATLFLRRGVSGEPWLDAHALDRTGGEWRILGGGSGNAGDVAHGPRPSIRELGALGVSLGGGATVRNAGRRLPWGARWVRWAELRAAREVERLVVGDRVMRVPEHGVALVVWRSRPPRVVAQDAAGSRLGEIAVADTLGRRPR